MLVFLSTIHVIVCLFLIGVVLLQQGKGADLSVFGGGGTQAAFGARGATTMLHKLTVYGFVGFILTTIGIGLLKTTARNASVITDVPVAVEATTEETATEDDAGAGVSDETGDAGDGQ
ncbi:MAG: preprotein translocase subunit SecG [Acidobacteria bacterium]|nr:preprotein translocase subunit SecG [Acidobacteriota bacterium]